MCGREVVWNGGEIYYMDKDFENKTTAEVD